MRTFRAETSVPASAEDLFAWHLRPGAFERLTPPWDRVVTEGPDTPVAEGSRRVLSVPVGPIRLRWVARHDRVEAGRGFRDVQESGPFASWRHEHRFEPEPGGGARLNDRIEYAVPLGRVGEALAAARVERTLARLFRHRHAITAADLERHARHASRPRRTVAITGASGLVGTALAAFLTAGGHRVRRVVRRAARTDDEIPWDPRSGATDLARWAGVDAVVHLAGDNIAAGRWTPARKRAIRDSRVDGTRLVADTLARLDPAPEVLVVASAVGYYGARDGDGPLGEDAGPGRGFLAETCLAWEAASEPAERAGIRVVRPRIGVVLSGRGGALARMVPAFLVGAGGRLGHGRQTMSWIALDDLVGILHEALFDDRLAGAVNATAPAPVDNATFARTLAAVLRRPAAIPVPAPALRVLFGEMAEALLLSGADVRPVRLERAGFRFRFADLETALRAELGRFPPGAPGGPAIATG